MLIGYGQGQDGLNIFLDCTKTRKMKNYILLMVEKVGKLNYLLFSPHLFIFKIILILEKCVEIL
jgi:hypothetical protein